MLRNIVAAMALLCVTAPVQAGVFGSVFQQITNQRIEVSTDNGATWTIATVGEGAGFDLTTGSTSYDVTAYARLGSTEIENKSLTSPDAQIAYISDQPAPGPGNNGAFTANPPIGANPSYVLSDTDGSGRLGNTGDLETFLVSSTQIDTAGLSSTGSTNSDMSTSASISSLQGVNTAGLYRYVADYSLQVVRSFTAPGPSDYSVTGNSTFIATLSRTGGSLGAGEDTNTPDALNVDLSGTADYDETFTSTIIGPQLEFAKGDVVRFNIQSSTSVAAAAVPEPATVLSFLGIGAAGFAARRRRRRAAIAAV